MKACVIQGDDVDDVISVPFNGSLEEARVLLCLDTGTEENIRERSKYITVAIIRTPIPDLVMLVDEDGMLKRLPVNHKAMMFYPGLIVGPAVLTYQQHIYVDGEPDIEFIGIPEGFDYKMVAETSYRRILDRLGDHPHIQYMDRTETETR